MATATFRHQGAAIDHTPGADVAAGDVVVQGELVGVAKLDIKAGRLGALAVEGVFDFPKSVGPSSAMPAGLDVYWDAAGQVATEDPSGGANKRIGRVVKDATDDDAIVRIRLSQ